MTVVKNESAERAYNIAQQGNFPLVQQYNFTCHILSSTISQVVIEQRHQYSYICCQKVHKYDKLPNCDYA